MYYCSFCLYPSEESRTVDDGSARSDSSSVFSQLRHNGAVSKRNVASHPFAPVKPGSGCELKGPDCGFNVCNPSALAQAMYVGVNRSRASLPTARPVQFHQACSLQLCSQVSSPLLCFFFFFWNMAAMTRLDRI